MFKKLPNSTRKFIRSEKARIRRQFLDYKVQKEAIVNMYNKILNQLIAKKTEVPEPVKLEKTSPKKPLVVVKRARQEKKTVKKYKKRKSK